MTLKITAKNPKMKILFSVFRFPVFAFLQNTFHILISHLHFEFWILVYVLFYSFEFQIRLNSMVVLQEKSEE